MKTQQEYEQFLKRVDKDLLSHQIIQENKYTEWFKQGNLSHEDVKNFTVQFSVFSNLFLVAQLKKMLNAENLDEMRASKEILCNELGTIFKRKANESNQSLEQRDKNKEIEGDPELVNTEGTIDGGVFKFRAAHFEWLLGFAKPLNLEFKDIGKRKHGTQSTLHFTDELERLYGNADFSIGAGASFAVENWAAAGFWRDLITGLTKFKEKENVNLHLAFFTWHDKVEGQHAAHTQEELKEIYFVEGFDEDKFIKHGLEMLDGVAIFWNGLNQEQVTRNQKQHSLAI
ncbi:MAG: hypothetical protein H7263_16710 [Candidatus Sericytochromatia bacterium]|nr:hypothetical protein [Candidatus Sericytochromatia bacterium]